MPLFLSATITDFASSAPFSWEGDKNYAFIFNYGAQNENKVKYM